MNIVFVSAEVAPWSKTGGLGDVLSGLPAALAARGHRVMTVAPRYDQYRDAWDTNTEWTAKMGDGEVTGRYFHTHKRGVDRVFIDHPCFLAKVWGKTGSKIYGNKTGVDYPDNQLRFSAFCQAALQAPLLLDLKNNPKFSGTYGEDVIFVANDWHTALVPAYLKSMYQSAGIFSSARVAYCVHNIAYQGRFPAEDFNLLNVPNQFKSAFTFTTAAAKTPGPKINWMKTGFMLSDKNFTVSPNYAKEITSGPSLGVELDSVIKQSGGIKGIINGMDVVEWNPATDKYLDTPYDESCPEVKMEIKAQLQAEVGLPVNPDVPLMVFVGRLEEQKGSDILIQSLPQILQNNCQLLVLGTGKKKYEKQLEQLEEIYPNKARGIVKFNVPLAHAMTAGADFFVVPSRFEPCGLIQLHAMRYGTVPIVASTGGLVDTVVEGVTGFHMGAMDTECEKVSPADTQACASTIKRALDVYATQPSTYKQMVHACMGQDLSWTGPSKEWERELLSMKAGGSWAAPGEDKIECVVEAKKPHNVAKPF
jgi:granule-bound starch synthase